MDRLPRKPGSVWVWMTAVILVFSAWVEAETWDRADLGAPPQAASLDDPAPPPPNAGELRRGPVRLPTVDILMAGRLFAPPPVPVPDSHSAATHRPNSGEPADRGVVRLAPVPALPPIQRLPDTDPDLPRRLPSAEHAEHPRSATTVEAEPRMLPLHASLLPIEGDAVDSVPEEEFVDLAPPMVESRTAPDAATDPADHALVELRRLPPIDDDGAGEDDAPETFTRRLPMVSVDSLVEPHAAFDLPWDRAGDPAAAQPTEEPVLLPVHPLGIWSDQAGARLDRTAQDAIDHQVSPRVAAAERLACRGAYFAARGELLKALSAITQSLDRHHATRRHSEALARALRALSEARDFTPHVSQLEVEWSVRQLVSGHRTRVLRDHDVDHLTVSAAHQAYLDYVQEQLVLCCGQLPVSSHVLYLLARIHTEMDRVAFERQASFLPQAIVLHRAALQVDPANGRAANELGVLLARYQQLDEAQRLLLHSVSTHPAPETWHNLSVVHERLGQVELARRASRQSEIVAAQHAEQPAGTTAGDHETPWTGMVPSHSPAAPFSGGTEYGPTIDSQPCPNAWELFAQGEYAGPGRDVDLPEYRLRVDDQLEFVYRLTRTENPQPYELHIGDRIRVESVTESTLDRDLVVQPDGMITLPMLGQIRAARRTVTELRDELESLYAAYHQVPAITVTPLATNTPWEDLRAAIAGREAAAGQSLRGRVTPEGTVQLPAIGSVPAQGLTLDELQQEIEARYASLVSNVGVTTRLLERAPRYVFVLGEVRQPGRYSLAGPTTAIQALAMAGGVHAAGQSQRIVVFRRAEDWQLMARCVNLCTTLQGKCLCPADDIWLRDSDIIIVPKKCLGRAQKRLDVNWLRSLLPLHLTPGNVRRPSVL